MPRQNNIRFRKGTYSEWDAQATGVLSSGEPGFITDFNKLKIGDGSTQWSDLSAINDALTTLVYNGTSSTIPKMSVVYINGAQGDLPSITLSIASGESSSSKTYGITTGDIAPNAVGQIVVDGALKSLNTLTQFSGVSPGTTLWLSPTISGGITTAKPYAPYHTVSLGNLIRVHQNQGVINVSIQNGFELEELHNVAVTGVAGGQFLQYNSASGLWVASSSGNFSTLNINGTGVSVSGHTHTTSNITDFNSSVSGLINVKNIVAGSNVTISNNNGIFTISSSGAVSRGAFLLTSSSGTFDVSGGYTVGSLDVFLNGVKLFASGDYTASNGTSFTLTTPAPSGSVIEYLSLVPGTNFSSGGVIVSNSGVNRLLVNDGSTSGIIAQSNLTFDGSSLSVNGSGIFGQNIVVSGIPVGTTETDVLLVQSNGTFVKRPSSVLGGGVSEESSIINALIFG